MATWPVTSPTASTCPGSSVAFTLDTYSHVIPTIQRVAAERLDQFLYTENVAKNDVPD